MRRFFIAVALILSLAAPAWAWSAAGHKYVASIAFSRLTPAEQIKVVAILREHPRFKQDFEGKLPAEATDDKSASEFYFQEMSVWPDVVRDYKGDDAKFNHGTWHYINVPSWLNESDQQALDGKLKVNIAFDPPASPVEQMNAIQTLKLSRKMLADKAVNPQDKAIMLSWLFHLTGDIHQPLHSTALFSQRLLSDGDRGGNRIRTVQSGNLHSLWDGLPGKQAKLRGAHNEAAKLMADSELANLGESAAAGLDEETWLNESRELAIGFTYSPELIGYLRNLEREGKSELQPFDFDPDYLKAGGKICDRRIIQAGYRLGAVLKQIID